MLPRLHRQSKIPTKFPQKVPAFSANFDFLRDPLSLRGPRRAHEHGVVPLFPCSLAALVTQSLTRYATAKPFIKVLDSFIFVCFSETLVQK